MRWPVTLAEGPVQLRPLRRRDGRTWVRLRTENRDWLAQWEATSPHGLLQPQSFGSLVRHHAQQARNGIALPLAIILDDELVGHVTLGPTGARCDPGPSATGCPNMWPVKG